MRRPGVGAGRRQGYRGIGSGGGGASPFVNPASDPLVKLWWDPTTPAVGAVASWVDKIASVDAAQGTAFRPTKSNTAMNGLPGLIWGSPSGLSAPGAGPVLAGLTGLTLVMSCVDTDTAVKVVIEYTLNASLNDGSFLFAVNDTAKNISAYCRATVGASQAYSNGAGSDLATPCVVSIGYAANVSGGGAVVFIRVNGVDLALTVAATASVAGVFANSTLYMGGRGPTPSLAWVGTCGHIVIRSGVLRDAGLSSIEAYVAAQNAITI